ncbi:MAG: helix-turn-helix domain-containing protein [Aquabacterium sp.]|nr:MAG: helix-turn-helix domain-containing protein [Aquabacterium sp.]
MPAPAPRTDHAIAARLDAIGQRLRAQRKALRISAATAAEAAQMSRVTLHRIERGEPSVAMGACLNAMAALGLEFDVVAPQAGVRGTGPAAQTPQHVPLADYPQLRRLAWHAPGVTELTPQEALDTYERNWRHLDRAALDDRERALIDRLVATVGKGKLLV